MEKLPFLKELRTCCVAAGEYNEYNNMEQAVAISSFGVRGAFPTTDAAALDFGGNTSCYLVGTEDGAVILDAGSGLTELAKVWDQPQADILITHLHLDHVMGLFSFPLLFDSGKQVNLYGPPGFQAALEMLLGSPYWPVGFSDFPARVAFRELFPEEDFRIGKIQVCTMGGNHPNGCLYYRLDTAGKRIVYALDCELTADFAPRLTDFCRGADLLVWDANFVSADLQPGWGHSTWEQGLGLAKEAGVQRVLLTHYCRDYSSGFLEAQEGLAQTVFPGCVFAREGKSYIF